MRPIALGRKNYLFMGSASGGRAGAIAYTLIETAKLNDVDPQTWLARVLDRIPDYKINRIHELLPWNYSTQQIRDRSPDRAGAVRPDAYAGLRGRALAGGAPSAAGREASIPFLHHRIVVGVAAPRHRADLAAFAEQGTVGLGRNAMLWVRCLAMGVDPSNAQCTGQVISGRLSNPRSPLQSGIQSRLTPKENQLDGGLAIFALTEACPVQVGRKPIRTRRPSRSYPKQTKNHLVSRSSRRSPCPPQPSHRIC